jgi:NADPH:quinone reductase-like Zn-dependent oxidoreductase
MKRRYKILIGVAGVLVVGYAALCLTVSYDSPCPPVPTVAAGTETMRSITQRCYGIPPQGVRIESVEKPKPKDDQVLIRVHASSVNPVEWYGTTGQPRLMRLQGGIGLPSDWKLGFDMAGTVEAVGSKVTRFKPGDEVYGGVHGALAEFVVAREQGNIALKPQNFSFEEAAGIPIAGITALQGLRDTGGLKPGQKVLINGASGGVGTYAVQIAKALGAEVTAVCSTRNAEMVRSLGADHVIDYTRENFTAGTARYDVILDNVGSQGFRAMADVMQPDGVIVVVGGSKKGPMLGPIKRVGWSKLVGPFIEPRIAFFIANVNQKDLEFLATLAREGKLKTVIDRRYPLEQTAGQWAGVLSAPLVTFSPRRSIHLDEDHR